MPSDSNTGHRQRLRERFLAGEEKSCTEEALLELLLTYAIPQKDVRPLAQKLLSEFNGLDGVLMADASALCRTEGVKDSAATLIKLIDWIRAHYPAEGSGQVHERTNLPWQASLFDLPSPEPTERAVEQPSSAATEATTPGRRVAHRGRGTALFGRAALKEAIDFLPRLPDTDSLEEIREFLRANLYFNSEQTRVRSAEGIMREMFPHGQADRALRTFAKAYAGRQQLRDVCYYRLCKAEPAMLTIADELLLPAIGSGQLPRRHLRDFVTAHLPRPNGVDNYTAAITSVLVASGLARAGRDVITLAYREVLIPSFAFIVHSEFAEPGMYDISELENNPVIRAMLWNPDRILPSLYELRNLGLISKVSEIDRVRQFTTKWRLDQVVELLVAGSETK